MLTEECTELFDLSEVVAKEDAHTIEYETPLLKLGFTKSEQDGKLHYAINVGIGNSLDPVYDFIEKVLDSLKTEYPKGIETC